MAYNSTLETAKIESALLASLKTKKIEYNITQDKSSSYASLSEAIAAVDDDEYKVKGIVLTFYTGTDWVSKRYNGEDASGFANEGNWIDVGGAAGGTQYLDLSMFSSETGSGTLSEEDYQKVVKAYEDGVIVGIWNNAKFNILMNSNPSIIGIIISLFARDTSGISLSVTQIEINKNDKTYKGSIRDIVSLFTLSMSGSGTKALTDSGQYVDFAVPTRVIKNTGGGPVTSELFPNILYKFGERPSLTITLGGGTVGIVNEYMFEFRSGTTATTLSVPNSVKWSGGNAPTIEANKTYQVSIVDNLALIASF